MKTTNKLLAATTVGLIGLGAISGAVIAADQKGDADHEKIENAAFMTARVTLSEAVKAAEAKTTGRAIEAKLHYNDGVMTYKLETLTADGMEQDVKVDAMDATRVIVLAEADKASKASEADEESDD